MLRVPLALEAGNQRQTRYELVISAGSTGFPAKTCPRNRANVSPKATVDKIGIRGESFRAFDRSSEAERITSTRRTDRLKSCMKLRFEVDQAECFRRGIDAPKSIVTIEVDPAKIDSDDRALIANRLDGIDVCELRKTEDRIFKAHLPPPNPTSTASGGPVRIIAKTPDYVGLIEAVRENEKKVDEQPTRYLDLGDPSDPLEAVATAAPSKPNGQWNKKSLMLDSHGGAICRICGLSFVIDSPDDQVRHEFEHRCLIDGGLPLEVREFLKGFGWAVAFNDGGVNRLMEHLNAEKQETAKRAVAFAYWTRAVSNGVPKTEFEDYMIAHFGFVDAKVARDGAAIEKALHAIQPWGKYGG